MANQNEETWPQILRNVWNLTARALRVVPRVNNGADYYDLAGGADGSVNVNVISGSISLSGADGAILDGVDSTIRATVFDYASSNPLAVTLVDTGGDPASVGGGTQYDEGVTDATITGTAAMWEDGSDTLRAISMAKPLPVQPGTSVAFPVTDNSGSLTVDGAVTANAGTNLNTSALALEAGGNLAAAATSLAIIDDWDETDRAKVNIIVGVAGVAANAGPASAGTQRVVTASDSPEVTSLAIMDDWDDGADRAKVTGSAGMAALVCTMGSVNATIPGVALEAGNLASAATSLGIIDDWDETDRAKVNPIVGQAGVAAGDGATGATTQRITMGVTEATYGTVDLQGLNLTSTSAWTLALATPSAPWRLIELINSTDQPIQVSFDGTNRRMTYPAGTGFVRDYFHLGLKVSTAVHVRNDGTAPSRGRVNVHGETV